MFPTEYGLVLDADGNLGFNFNGIFAGIHSWMTENDSYYDKFIDGMPLSLDTYLQPSYHSNERESRPKTKFFSLLIYAGYPTV